MLEDQNKSPYECYWRDRAFRAEKELIDIKAADSNASTWLHNIQVTAKHIYDKNRQGMQVHQDLEYLLLELAKVDTSVCDLFLKGKNE